MDNAPQTSRCGGPRRSEAPQRSRILFFWNGFLFPDRIKYSERSGSELTNNLGGPRLPSRSGRGRHDIEASKGKAVPLQAWSGPEGSRKLRFPDFMTTAQEGGKVVSLTHRPHLLPGNSPGTHFC